MKAMGFKDPLQIPLLQIMVPLPEQGTQFPPLLDVIEALPVNGSRVMMNQSEPLV